MKKSKSQIFIDKKNNNLNSEQKIKVLESQNITLKKKLQIFIQKEKYYISEINNLKNNQLNDDLNLLNQEIFNKNEIIVSLQDEIYSLNKKIDEVKLNNYFKEKEYENKIKSERIKLNEIKLIIKNITKEATETLNDLSQQLENIPKQLNLNEGYENINNKSNLKSIQNNLNQLYCKMCKNFKDISNNYEQKNESLNKLKYELSLLKSENNKLRKEIQLKNNEIKSLRKSEILDYNKDNNKYNTLNLNQINNINKYYSDLNFIVNKNDK